MINASDLIGCTVCTESGERIGRVHDLRARKLQEGWELVGLVVGRSGLMQRLVSPGSEPLVRGGLVRWQAVTSIAEGRITLRDGTTVGG